MVKAGLIIGAIVFVLGLISGIAVSPVCIPCLVIFAGVAAGYLANQFDRPSTNNLAVSNAAKAGAIAGVAALLANVVAGLFNASVLGPEGAAELMTSLGFPTEAGNPVVHYGSAALASCCLGLFEIALMAGTGALGGMLWFNTAGKNQGGAPPAPAAPAM